MSNNNNATTVQSMLNMTTTTAPLNLSNETITAAQIVPDYKVRRANFIWPEDPVDEIPVK